MRFSTWVMLWVLLAAGVGRGEEFTFAVVGDNRGYTDGKQTQAFLKIVDELVRANPELVLHTGDMIAGDLGDPLNLKQQWDAYKQAIAPLKMPIYHAPGNHDTDTDASMKLYPQVMGKLHYVVEHKGCLFVALDTETFNGRLGRDQWDFLQRTLNNAGEKPVFLFLHRPLFSFGIHVKFCLDEYPEERDALHRLFVAHKKNIKAVFVGHEHMYAREERDGINYYTCGGGGAVLYAPPELGGFYHYLLVHVKGNDARVELHKVLLRPEPERETVKLAAGTLMDGFEAPLFWNTFNYTTHAAPTTAQHSDGARALRFEFDGARFPWPTLYTVCTPAADLREVKTISVDVLAPQDLPAGFTMTLVVSGKVKGYESPKVPIKAGWNTFTADLTGEWLEDDGRANAAALLWNLDCNQADYAGSLVFDHLRCELKQGAKRPGGPVLGESWETKLLWQAFNPTASQERFEGFHTERNASMKLSFDLERCPSPRFYATLDPMMDMGDVGALTLDVLAPPGLPRSTLRLVVVSKGQRYLSPPITLKSNSQQKLEFRLDEAYLPVEAKKQVEQIEFELTSPASVGKSWIAVDNLRAER